MDSALFVLTFVAALGCGLMAGAFFAFSSFVMQALGRLAPAAGIAAMQSINIVVINRLFLGVLFGTGALCLVLAVMAPMALPWPGTAWSVAGSVLYVVGNVVVTMVGNVPLNNALAAARPESAEGAELWARYLVRWTAWNHVRTVTGIAATACFILALI
jgi:uncharacterized membrane protein